MVTWIAEQNLFDINPSPPEPHYLLETVHAYSMRARPAKAIAPAPTLPLLAAPVYSQTGAEEAGETGAELAAEGATQA